MRWRNILLSILLILLSLIALLVGVGVAQAQAVPPWVGALGLDQPSYLAPSPLRASNSLLRRSGEYSGIALSDWLFYPDALAGVTYNDNLNHAAHNRTGSLGARLQADVVGIREAGASKTVAYGGADAYLYPGHTPDDTFTGRVGISHVLELQSGFTVKAQIEWARLSYPTFGSLVATPSGGATSLVAPQTYRQLLTSAAAQKTLGRFFLGASIGETATFPDALATSVGSLSQDYRDNALTTLTERAGYWLSPLLYTFAETSQNTRQYVDNRFASQGYRAIAGLGSDRIGLFRGEIFAGFQGQLYRVPLIGAARSPVFGGKLFWYLSRAWTLTGSLDETFSDATDPTPSNPVGNPAHVTSLQLQAEYQLGHRWSAQGLAQFDVSRYLGVNRVDDTWTTELVVNREIARNLNVNLDYKLIRNHSNAAGSSFTNNILGAGALYKF